eukprot:gene2735-2912_t
MWLVICLFLIQTVCKGIKFDYQGLLEKALEENQTRNQWKLEKWKMYVDLEEIEKFPLKLPISSYAIVILCKQVNFGIFHWTKFLPADQFTVFFIEDYKDCDEIVDFDSLLQQRRGKYNLDSITRNQRFVIRMKRKHPKTYGYQFLSYIVGEVCAWDKAMFLLSELAPRYKFTWWFEEDVFIPTIQSFYKVHSDATVKNSDLATNQITNASDLNGWLWSEIPTFRDKDMMPPYYYSLNPAVGISWRLISEIRRYRYKFGRLDFQEALLPTIAMKRNLSIYYIPNSLRTIRYRHDWSCRDFIEEPFSWFHPVKNQVEVLKKCKEERIWNPDFTSNQVNPWIED